MSMLCVVDKEELVGCYECGEELSFGDIVL